MSNPGTSSAGAGKTGVYASPSCGEDVVTGSLPVGRALLSQGYSIRISHCRFISGGCGRGFILGDNIGSSSRARVDEGLMKCGREVLNKHGAVLYGRICILLSISA